MKFIHKNCTMRVTSLLQFVNMFEIDLYAKGWAPHWWQYIILKGRTIWFPGPGGMAIEFGLRQVFFSHFRTDKLCFFHLIKATNYHFKQLPFGQLLYEALHWTLNVFFFFFFFQPNVKQFHPLWVFCWEIIVAGSVLRKCRLLYLLTFSKEV